MTLLLAASCLFALPDGERPKRAALEPAEVGALEAREAAAPPSLAAFDGGFAWLGLLVGVWLALVVFTFGVVPAMIAASVG